MDWARSGKRVYLRLIERRVFDQAALVHYTTQQERVESEHMIDTRACRVIPTPVSQPRVERHEARSRLGISEAVLLVLFVGRLDPIKRCDVLVRALASARPETTLALVGPDWGARRELQGLVRSLGLADRVLFVGPQRRTELERWYAAADLFAMASAHENFGLAAAEACAAGLPCVLPAELPIAEDLGEACLGVDRSPAAFAKGIGELSDAAARQRLGARARAHAAAHWSDEVVGRSLREMYEAAMNASRGPGTRSFYQ